MPSIRSVFTRCLFLPPVCSPTHSLRVLADDQVSLSLSLYCAALSLSPSGRRLTGVPILRGERTPSYWLAAVALQSQWHRDRQVICSNVGSLAYSRRTYYGAGVFPLLRRTVARTSERTSGGGGREALVVARSGGCGRAWRGGPGHAARTHFAGAASQRAVVAASKR